MLLVGGAGRCLACFRALPPQKSTRTNTRTARTARDWIYIMNIYIYYLNNTSIPSQSNISESNPNCSPRRCAVTSSRRLRRTSIERVAGITRVLVKVEAQLLADLRQWVFREHLGSLGGQVGRWAARRRGFGVHIPPSYLATRHLDLALGPSVQPRPHHLVRERECLLA